MILICCDNKDKFFAESNWVLLIENEDLIRGLLIIYSNNYSAKANLFP